jgi:hypothetical protein
MNTLTLLYYVKGPESTDKMFINIGYKHINARKGEWFKHEI